jgi:hypothetical protein
MIVIIGETSVKDGDLLVLGPALCLSHDEQGPPGFEGHGEVLVVAKPTPRRTPSRVNPAFSNARCSARLVISVAASIRFTWVCANKYRTSCRCASVPCPCPRASGVRATPMVQQWEVRAVWCLRQATKPSRSPSAVTMSIQT